MSKAWKLLLTSYWFKFAFI